MQRLNDHAIRDMEAVLHPVTNLQSHRDGGGLVVNNGSGIWVYDRDGKPYLEAMAGLWCNSLGHGNKELIETAREQMSRLSFAHLFGGRSHEPAIQLAEKIKALSPAPASKIFFTTSGSEANDTQIKLAWYLNNARGRPKKKKIISRRGAYHGTTMATASLTGLDAFHSDFDLPMARVIYTNRPHHWREAEDGETEAQFATRLALELETLIRAEDPETIAAFIAEPVMGAGGVIVPPETYFEKISRVLRRYDIALIADEVICGFGRTGKMFGSQTFNMSPHTVTMAKALTSGYAPLGAITISDDMYQACLENSSRNGMFGHGYTYTGHPLSCAIALKTLEIYERKDILTHVQRTAQVFKIRLDRLNSHPIVGNARGVGLLAGIELVRDKKTKDAFAPSVAAGAAAVRYCEREGLLCRALVGDTLAICPPLIINGAEVNVLFDRLTAALDRTHEWAKTEGHLD